MEKTHTYQKNKLINYLLKKSKQEDINNKDVKLVTVTKENQEKLEEEKSYLVKTRTEESTGMLIDSMQ